MRIDEPLAQPIQIGTKTATNRFVMNAMECCDSDEQGNPTAPTYERYTNLFKGDAGMIVLEAITVGYENRSRAVPAVHHAAQPETARKVRLRNAQGQRQAAVHLPADAFGRAEPHRVFQARLRQAAARLRRRPAQRRGRGQDHRPVCAQREDRARRRRGRRRPEALPRLPRLADPAPLQRPQMEIRRPVGKPPPVRL